MFSQRCCRGWRDAASFWSGDAQSDNLPVGHRLYRDSGPRSRTAGTVLRRLAVPKRDLTMTDTGSSAIRFGRIAAMLPVRDMAKAQDFYSGALGFTKTFQNGDPVGFMILKRDDAELHLTLQPGHKAAPFNIAHMMVEDIDAVHAIIRARGLRIVKDLRDKDYGLRAFVFEDPDGNRIDVGQPLRR
jgi:catechol 2,3-dioxygenase-like lactoylglutathione lyase family enzyme